MSRKTSRCAECGKKINKSNPSYSGGGSFSYDGKWTAWRLGACCRKPITVESLKELMAEVFRLSAPSA